jgi:hypothetical protein
MTTGAVTTQVEEYDRFVIFQVADPGKPLYFLAAGKTSLGTTVERADTIEEMRKKLDALKEKPQEL